MKNKDYVGQTAQKRPKASKELAPSRRPFPILKALIVLALVAGFGYFLATINQNAPEQPTNTTSKNKEASVEKADEVEIPPLPENEEWQFIEELENKQVEVTAEELEDKGPYKMQCASLRQKDQAEALKAKIAFAGFESEVRSVKGSSGIWHKVVLGPFEKKRDAEKVRHVLRRNNINYCEIWLWR